MVNKILPTAATAKNFELLLLEAGATMVIAKPGHDAHWSYRRGTIERVLETVTAMIMRATGARTARVRRINRVGARPRQSEVPMAGSVPAN